MKRHHITFFLLPFVLAIALFSLSSCEKDEGSGSTAVRIIEVYRITNDSLMVDISLQGAQITISQLGVYILGDDDQVVRFPAESIVYNQRISIGVGPLQEATEYEIFPYYEEASVLKTGQSVIRTTPNIVEDTDGNEYPTVKFYIPEGNNTFKTMTWTRVNLSTKSYNNGAPVIYLNDAVEGQGAWSQYPAPEGDDIEKHGLLYNWYAVEEGLCPEGWDVPGREDWADIFNLYGGQARAGNELKSNEWDGNDRSGLSILASGYNYAGGSIFDKLGETGMYWTRTEEIAGEDENDNEDDPNGEDDNNEGEKGSQYRSAWRVQFYTAEPLIGSFYNYLTHGFSVRCVRIDSETIVK